MKKSPSIFIFSLLLVFFWNLFSFSTSICCLGGDNNAPPPSPDDFCLQRHIRKLARLEYKRDALFLSMEEVKDTYHQIANVIEQYGADVFLFPDLNEIADAKKLYFFSRVATLEARIEGLKDEINQHTGLSESEIAHLAKTSGNYRSLYQVDEFLLNWPFLPDSPFFLLLFFLTFFSIVILYFVYMKLPHQLYKTYTNAQ